LAPVEAAEEAKVTEDLANNTEHEAALLK
jgi:hypothetical protein